MKQIRFKNDYEKLPKVWDRTQGLLIACYPETLTNLKNKYSSFLKRDTKIRHKFPRDHIKQHYPMTHENLLILVFIHYNTGMLIHTLRHNNEDNFELYINSIGETFEFLHK